jgi:branched-subunit amino acid transport protein
LLPTAEQYLPRWLPLVMVWVCLGFMWMEAILGFCVGCQLHALFVKFGWVKDECEACNNLNFN